MSCDLGDPAILENYNAIISGAPTNWLVLGYHDTRDKLSLYSKGTGGVAELQTALKEEVLYGFVRVDDRFALISFVPEQVSGLRRARALVHGKAVSALFKRTNVQINTANLADVTEDSIRTRLGNVRIESPPTPDPVGSPDRPSTPSGTTGAAASALSSPIPTSIPPRPSTPVSPNVLTEAVSPVRAASPAPIPVPVTPVSVQKQVPETPVQVLKQVQTPPTPAQDPVPAPAPASAPAPVPVAAASPVSVPSPPTSAPLSPRAERQLEMEAKERQAREDLERQKRAEALKRQKETEEREAREKELWAKKQADELERRRKEEAERASREAMKQQLIEMEQLRGAGLSGFITIQNGGSPYWKRRFYVMRGQVLTLYRDEDGRAPVAEIKLGGRVVHIEDVSLEVLIRNTFRVDLYTGDSHLFFCDTPREKDMAIAGIMKCNESS